MARVSQQEGGFGIVELMIAMTVLAIGIMAIVAGFSSGIVSLDRASRTGTAGTLADKQMEGYRALAYSGILLTDAPSTTPDSLYTSDVAHGPYDAGEDVPAGTCTTGATCEPVQPSVTGPDGRSYRVDTYIVWACPVGTLVLTAPYSTSDPGCVDSVDLTTVTSRAVKQITVVVRDGANPSKTYIRETSTFDQAT